MKPLRILVIDDESVICDACRLVLAEKGHAVDRCLTGKTGLLAIERSTYDLILLDMKLPDIDGTEILKIVREKASAPCVIVMTGYSTMSNALQAMKLGAADYLAKPFTDDELIEASTAESMQFVELVRRASIVNSGGYYLHTESEAVRTLFDAPSTDTEPRLGEHNDPFLLLVVNINAEVGADIEADVDPTVITNALMAPFSSLNNVDLDKPDSDGSENSEFDWNAPFLESGTTIHEPIHAPGVVPLRFKLPDPDPVAEADTDNIVADMCTRFTMLDYAVPKSIEDGNNIWIRSGDGLQFHETLPVGPTEPNGKGSEKDMPMLHFDLNIPAARLLVDEEDSSADLINPYGAVGEELTILYRLRDIYGNSIGAEHTHKQKIQFIDRIARISDLPLLSMLWKPEYNSPDFGRGLQQALVRHL